MILVSGQKAQLELGLNFRDWEFSNIEQVGLARAPLFLQCESKVMAN
jgi:hypothetical protein